MSNNQTNPSLGFLGMSWTPFVFIPQNLVFFSTWCQVKEWFNAAASIETNHQMLNKIDCNWLQLTIKDLETGSISMNLTLGNSYKSSNKNIKNVAVFHLIGYRWCFRLCIRIFGNIACCGSNFNATFTNKTFSEYLCSCIGSNLFQPVDAPSSMDFIRLHDPTRWGRNVVHLKIFNNRRS